MITSLRAALLQNTYLALIHTVFLHNVPIQKYLHGPSRDFRHLRPRPHQQQCRSNVRLCCQKRQQCRTSFALKFRPFDKVERCFDIVASVDRAEILIRWLKIYFTRQILPLIFQYVHILDHIHTCNYKYRRQSWHRMA